MKIKKATDTFFNYLTKIVINWLKEIIKEDLEKYLKKVDKNKITEMNQCFNDLRNQEGSEEITIEDSPDEDYDLDEIIKKEDSDESYDNTILKLLYCLYEEKQEIHSDDYEEISKYFNKQINE